MARKKSSKSNGVTATISSAADSVKEKAAELGGAVASKELADVQPLEATLRLPPPQPGN